MILSTECGRTLAHDCSDLHQAVRQARHSAIWLGFADRNLEWSHRVGPGGRASKRLLNTLRSTSGKSWFGGLKCASPGEPEARFFVVVHDLRDCAVAMVYCGDSKAGPAEVLVVVPAELRSSLRPEFAFEFLAFSSFLGAVSESAAITVQDRITAAMEECPPRIRWYSRCAPGCGRAIWMPFFRNPWRRLR